jgi:hypothetical protein
MCCVCVRWVSRDQVLAACDSHCAWNTKRSVSAQCWAWSRTTPTRLSQTTHPLPLTVVCVCSLGATRPRSASLGSHCAWYTKRSVGAQCWAWSRTAPTRLSQTTHPLPLTVVCECAHWASRDQVRGWSFPLCLVHQAQCECTVLGLVSHDAHSVESYDACSPAECAVCVSTKCHETKPSCL